MSWDGEGVFTEVKYVSFEYKIDDFRKHVFRVMLCMGRQFKLVK